MTKRTAPTDGFFEEVPLPPDSLIPHEAYDITPMPEAGEADATDTDWPEPLPLPSKLVPVDVMTPDMVPLPYREYATTCAANLGCALSFVVVPMVVATSIVIGRQLGLRPKVHEEWIVVTNQWGAIVGMPASKKSPALRHGLAPLRTLQQDARATFEASHLDHKWECETGKAVREAVTGDLRKLRRNDSFDAEDEAKLKARFIEAETAESPRMRFYEVADSTVEAITELLKGPPNDNGLLVLRDELYGWYTALQKPGRDGDRQFYLESYDGTTPFGVNRIGRGDVSIEATCISVFGGIQPDKLSTIVRGIAQGDDDGLIQRLQLAVWPDMPPPCGWVDESMDDEIREEPVKVLRLLSKLRATSYSLIGHESVVTDAKVPYLRFSDLAQAAFQEWYEEHELRTRAEPEAVLQGRMGKVPATVASLALIFHTIDIAGQVPHVHGPVGTDALDMALRWARFLESHARRIYGQAIDSAPVNAHKLASKIRASKLGDQFKIDEVRDKGWAGLKTSGEIHAALDLLAESNVVRVIRTPTKGRTAIDVLVNPKFTE